MSASEKTISRLGRRSLAPVGSPARDVLLYDGGIVPDPEGIITAGHDNKTARTVAFRNGEPINATALTAMFKHIIANNRAGGWRKVKRKTR